MLQKTAAESYVLTTVYLRRLPALLHCRQTRHAATLTEQPQWPDKRNMLHYSLRYLVHHTADGRVTLSLSLHFLQNTSANRIVITSGTRLT